MYQGSPWLLANNLNNINQPYNNLAQMPIIGIQPSNNTVQSLLQPSNNIVHISTPHSNTKYCPMVSVASTHNIHHMPPSLPSHIHTHLSQPVVPAMSNIHHHRHSPGGAILQQALAARILQPTTSTTSNKSSIGQTPFIGDLQQHFVHNFSFINSSNYHSLHKPPTPPRHPPTLEEAASANNLYSKTQSSQILETLENINEKYDSNRTPDKSIESTGDNLIEEQQDYVSSDEDCTNQASEMRKKGQKRSSDSNTPQSSKRRCSTDRQSVSLVPTTTTGVPRVLNDQQYEQISVEIWNHYEKNKQTEDVYDRKMKLREALYAIVKGIFPYCGLYIVGSSMNGFGSCSSDMDLCIMLSLTDLDQRTEATEILMLLMKAMRRCTFLKNIQLIRAKVPILKFYDHVSGVYCDLNVNNWVGIRNTHLLNAYSKVDYRVCPLVLFVKHWASFHDINDASKGTLSSYSLAMLVLHYLQAGCEPPVIPSLQQKFPNKFSRDIDIRTITLNETLPQFASPNNSDVGQLFIGFLYYYANMEFEKFGISVRLGGKIKISELIGQNPNVQKQWSNIGIEEPFDLSNTARAVYTEKVFERVKRVIRVSYLSVVCTGSLQCLFERQF